MSYRTQIFALGFVLPLFLSEWVPRVEADIHGSVDGFQIRENLITLELSSEPQLRQHFAVSPERMKTFKSQALERLIDRELFFAEAKRRKVVPGTKTVEENITRAAASVGGKDKLARLLQDGGLSMAQYSDWILKNLAASALRDYIYRPATTAEARDYYALHTTEFVQPVRAKVHMVLIPLAPLATTTEVTGGEKAAVNIAAEWSAQPATEPALLAARFQSRFIDMGMLHEGSVVEGVSETVFALQPGQISSPLRTIYGWHVVRVLERFPQRLLTFEEVAPAIRANLSQKRGDQEYLLLLESLRAKAVILRNQ